MHVEHGPGACLLRVVYLGRGSRVSSLGFSEPEFRVQGPRSRVEGVETTSCAVKGFPEASLLRVVHLVRSTCHFISGRGLVSGVYLTTWTSESGPLSAVHLPRRKWPDISQLG